MCVGIASTESLLKKTLFWMVKKKIKKNPQTTECFILQSPVAIFICLAHPNNVIQNVAK